MIEYDAWGNATVVYADGILSTDMAMLRIYNPFRYRGYYYDVETGLYYLQSRYYNPEWGRFINADAYISTGQGLIGNNMFAYSDRLRFHEQYFIIDPVGEDIDLLTGNINLGGALILATGGWEYDNVDFSLLDFFKFSAGVSFSPEYSSAEVGIAFWEPSLAVNAFDGTLEISASLGYKFGLEYGKKYGFSLGVFGISYEPN